MCYLTQYPQLVLEHVKSLRVVVDLLPKLSTSSGFVLATQPQSGNGDSISRIGSEKTYLGELLDAVA
jgi:hypothetical protein